MTNNRDQKDVEALPTVAELLVMTEIDRLNATSTLTEEQKHHILKEWARKEKE